MMNHNNNNSKNKMILINYLSIKIKNINKKIFNIILNNQKYKIMILECLIKILFGNLVNH
jgi:hypothetical protein